VCERVVGLRREKARWLWGLTRVGERWEVGFARIVGRMEEVGLGGRERVLGEGRKIIL